ncbi:MAG: UPF0280 family protein [Odoribacter splanchnicus]
MYRRDRSWQPKYRSVQNDLSGITDGYGPLIGLHPDYAQALTPFRQARCSWHIQRDVAGSTNKRYRPDECRSRRRRSESRGKPEKRFGIKEVIVENGGDIYADLCQDMDISVFAGSSPLSEKVGLHIEAAYAPLGICTSSGTVGPSLSFGKADAVMIVCSDVILADTYATAFANTIQTAEDVQTCIEKIREQEDILAAIAIKDDKLGICGNFELKLF